MVGVGEEMASRQENRAELDAKARQGQTVVPEEPAEGVWKPRSTSPKVGSLLGLAVRYLVSIVFSLQLLKMCVFVFER